MLDGYYYCLNCHSEITPDYNEHCPFCGCSAVAVSGDYSNEEVERAFDLLNKEQQGLVIVPPCKVGDKVYLPCVNDWGDIENYTITEFVLDNNGLCFVVDDEDRECHSVDNIGKTVFLNIEEAEQALKEGADNG